VKIAVADLGLSNLGSAVRALRSLGAEATSAARPVGLAAADVVVVPGVGAFEEAARRLEESGLGRAVLDAHARGAGVLGICLGMQLLFEEGEEGGASRGLGLLPGRVRRLRSGASLPLPHVGWNRARPTEAGRPLFGEGGDFYFVHSFVAEPADDAAVLARTLHGEEFPSAVAGDRAIGFQFHPEKSGRAGLAVLAAALERLALT
jgi:glutamine amidotransferase